MKKKFHYWITCKIFGHKRTKCVDLDGNCFIACLRCNTYLSTLIFDEYSGEYVEQGGVE